MSEMPIFCPKCHQCDAITCRVETSARGEVYVFDCSRCGVEVESGPVTYASGTTTSEVP